MDGTVDEAPTPGRRLRGRPGGSRDWDRNWDKPLGIATAAGLVAITIAAVFVRGPAQPSGPPRPALLPVAPTSGVAGTPRATSAPTDATTSQPDPSDSFDSSDWYAGTASTRSDLSSAATLVRHYVEANDGRSLEPACAGLATQVTQARRRPGAADVDVQRLWSGGLDLYTEATTACGQLFDGTQLDVGVLVERTTTALDQADRVWGELDRLVTGTHPRAP